MIILCPDPVGSKKNSLNILVTGFGFLQAYSKLQEVVKKIRAICNKNKYIMHGHMMFQL